MTLVDTGSLVGLQSSTCPANCSSALQGLGLMLVGIHIENTSILIIYSVVGAIKLRFIVPQKTHLQSALDKDHTALTISFHFVVVVVKITAILVK